MIRSAVSLMLTVSVVRAEKWTSYLGTKRLWPILAMRGFVGATSMTLYYEAIQRMPLADAVSPHLIKSDRTQTLSFKPNAQVA